MGKKYEQGTTWRQAFMLSPGPRTAREAALLWLKGVCMGSADIIPGVSGGTPYFASDQPKYVIAFQAYKVLLFNSTDKTVTVSLYAYLTN